jgi:hypothetical protein
MIRNTFHVLAAALAAASTVGCGGRTDAIGTTDQAVSTLSALESGATTQRAYVGVTNEYTVGPVPVVAAFDLLGGAQIETEVVTRDGSPLRFEVWRVRLDGTADLEVPVDSRSGFALQQVDADENGTWLLRFPAGADATVRVHMDCIGGARGCSVAQQPGDSCPAGWSCDVGLQCELPIGACGSLAAAGTCVVAATSCADDIEAVCGCDGHTYPSECSARAVGQPILHAGACP